MDKRPPISRHAAQPTGIRLVGLRAGSRLGGPLLSAEDLAERGRQEVRTLMAMRRKALERQWQRQLAASGIPERFRSKGFADYQADIAGRVLARSVCQDYACALSAGQRPGETLLLGGPGTGKTHLACAILATLVRAGQRGWYVSLHCAACATPAHLDPGAPRPRPSRSSARQTCWCSTM